MMRIVAATGILAATALGLTAVWDWPVAPPREVITAYSPPLHAYGPGHRGIDIAAPDGVLTAPDDAVVHFVGTVVDRGVLTLRHADGTLSSYEPVTSTLAKGDTVTRGQLIGTVMPGHCAELCLHLGVRVEGQYVSPLLFLGGIPRAVLLPRW